MSRFSVDVEEQTRTMHTEVDVPNPQRVLMPGMYAEATLTMNRRPSALVVPPEAINIEDDNRSVWLVHPDGKVEHRPVTVGVETPEAVELISGLSQGEMRYPAKWEWRGLAEWYNIRSRRCPDATNSRNFISRTCQFELREPVAVPAG